MSFMPGSGLMDWLLAGKLVGATGVVGVAGKFAWTKAAEKASSVAAVARRIPAALDKVDLIHKEVFPNGGGSLRDSVNRMESAQAIGQALTRTLASMSREAMLVGDKLGMCVWVSERFTGLSGITNDEARGNGWVNAVHAEDRDRVIHETEQAWEQERTYIGEFRLRHRETQMIFQVYCCTELVRDIAGNVQGFITSIRTDSRNGPTERRATPR